MSVCNKICLVFLVWLLAMPSVFAGPLVQASIKPLQLIAAELTDGLAASPAPLLPPGKTIHDFSLKLSDVARVKQADFLLWLGPTTEPYLQAMAAQKEPAKVIDVSTLPGIGLLPLRYVGETYGHHQGGAHADTDPHLWLSIDNVLVIAEALEKKLSRVDPAHSERYKQNLLRFKASLASLEPYRKRFAQQKVVYVVYHDAYQYLESYLGLKPLAVVTSEPEISPGVRHLIAVAQLIEREQVNCFVASPLLPPKIVPVLFKGRDPATYRVIVLDELAGTASTRYSDFMTSLLHELSQCVSAQPAG